MPDLKLFSRFKKQFKIKLGQHTVLLFCLLLLSIRPLIHTDEKLGANLVLLKSRIIKTGYATYTFTKGFANQVQNRSLPPASFS